jgi:hypothetical protein
MRRLDRGQPGMLPSDRTTRDALQGDPRERRERIMRGQADAQRSGLAPTPGTPRQLQRPNDAGAGPPPSGGKGRGPLSAGGPDGAAVSSPTPSATTVGPLEARSPEEHTSPRGQRRATSGPQQGVESEQAPAASAPREAQRQWQRRSMPQPAEPQEAQPRVAPRQWQQRPDARQMPPPAAPRDTQAPVQRQWQRQPMPPSAEPRQMAPQSASRSQSVQPRQRADGQGGQHRQRRRDEAAQPSP